MKTCRETTLLIAGAIVTGVILSSSCENQTESTEKSESRVAARAEARARFQKAYRMSSGDTTAPSIPAVCVYEIVRGHPENSGLGRIFLAVSARDDMTPVWGLEYSLTVLGGDPPEGLELPTGIIYPYEYFADGERLDMITLEWDDGSSENQDGFDFQLVLYAVDRAGNTSEASDTVRVEHSGRYIDIVFEFGVMARNRLDTTRGIFIKDMISDPPLTLDLTLTEEERGQVLAKAKEIGFFHLPRVLAPDSRSTRYFPCSSFYLEIRVGNMRHGVSWDNCFSGQKESLKELSRVITTMITSKEAYKRSPKPTGGYI